MSARLRALRALITDVVGRRAPAANDAAPAAADVDPARFPRSARVPFLVTGASGKVGRAMVARLRAPGHRVRVIMRRVPEAPHPDVE